VQCNTEDAFYNGRLRATPRAWLKLVAKFYCLAILQNRKLLKKEEIHNSLAILQNHIACVSGWLYMASENQEIANFTKLDSTSVRVYHLLCKF
jgi:hypothetical protein